MTARKSAKKSTAPRKASAKKKPAAARKKASASKKTGAEKKAPAKKKTPEKKKARAKKAPVKKKLLARDQASAKGKPAAAAGDPAPQPKSLPGLSTLAQPQGAALSLQVNFGHVFSLRPRVNTSFRQEDFRSARHLLESQLFDSLEDAARAVVEKALELTHAAGDTGGRGFRP